MKLNLKQKYGAVKSDVHTVLKNLDHLVESASLLVVSIFTYLVLTSKVDGGHLNTLGRYTVMGAVVVIGFRGAYEMLRYLANK